MRMLKPSMRVADLSIARLPSKVAEPIYHSAWWKETRARIFARDRMMCVVPDCRMRAVVCEHVVSRRNGGGNDDSNLVSLCRYHDNRFKENSDGSRSNAEEWASIFRPKG